MRKGGTDNSNEALIKQSTNTKMIEIPTINKKSQYLKIAQPGIPEGFISQKAKKYPTKSMSKEAPPLTN